MFCHFFSSKKDIFYFLLFLLSFTLSQKTVAQQYTADFSSAPTLIPGPYWIDTAQVTLGGQIYYIVSGGNGGWAYKNTGGFSNGANIQYDCAATTNVRIIRKGGGRFAFYGAWLKYSDITTGLYNTPPFVTVTYVGSTDTVEVYGPNTTTVLSKNVSVTAVNIYIVGLLQLNFDNLIVGPAPITLPVTTTNSVNSYNTTTATLGNNVTDDGAGTITDRGIVYNTTGSPSTSDTKVQIGSGTGSFSQLVTGLTSNVKYYVRAYAINSAGTAYGSEVNFTTEGPFVLQSTHAFNGGSWSSTTNQTSPYTKFIQGWNVTAASTGSGNASVSRITGSNSADTAAAIRAQCPTSAENLAYMAFKVSDGTHFDLQNFKFRYATRTTGTSFSTIVVTGYANGVPASGAVASLSSIQPISANTAYNTFDFSAISQFRNIDEFRITAADPVNSARLYYIDLDLLTVKNIFSISSNAALINIILSTGALLPTFDSVTTSYSATVENEVTKITVMPVKADSTCTVRVNGEIVTSAAPSDSINLVVGDNLITVEVTAQDGTTIKSYVITVQRTPSANATLSGITPAAGDLSPAFDSSITSYTTMVENEVTTYALTPLVFDTTATIRVNGQIVSSGSASEPVNLTVGENMITVEVTAQDGTTVKSYTITVNRAASINAALTGLTPAVGVLSPAFDPLTTSYTSTVGNEDTLYSVIAVTADTTATIRVNGQIISSGNASEAINLTVGENLITVQVTAQDGTTISTYSIVVTREGSSVAVLDTLTLSIGMLTPAFDTSVSSYIVDVDNSTTTFTITPQVADTTATIRVNGQIVTNGSASEPVDLVVGDNIITLEIISQNGTTIKTYTINARRSSTILPVTLSDLNAHQTGNAIKVSWTTYNQSNIEKFVVEKSHDGNHFINAGETASQNNTQARTYTWQDNNPFEGDNFYRIKPIDKNGLVKYSTIIKIVVNKKTQFIKIFPNPLKNKLLSIQLNNMPAGKYDMMLYNRYGQIILAKSIIISGPSAAKSIQLPATLGSGMYDVELTNGQVKFKRRVIVE